MQAYRAIALFADDVRIEEDGKITAVGVYGDDIVIKSARSELVSISTLIRVVGSLDFQLENIRIEFSLSDRVIGRAAIEKRFIQEVNESRGRIKEETTGLLDKTEDDFLIAQGVVTISIPTPSAIAVLSVRVDVGDGFISAGNVPVKWVELSSEG